MAGFRFELIFVNGFGLPYNSGVLVYIVYCLLGGFVYGIWKTYQKRKYIIQYGFTDDYSNYHRIFLLLP